MHASDSAPQGTPVMAGSFQRRTHSPSFLYEVYVRIDVVLVEDFHLSPLEGLLGEGALALLGKHRLRERVPRVRSRAVVLAVSCMQAGLRISCYLPRGGAHHMAVRTDGRSYNWLQGDWVNEPRQWVVIILGVCITAALLVP